MGALLFVAKWMGIQVHKTGTFSNYHTRFGAFCGAFWRRTTTH